MKYRHRGDVADDALERWVEITTKGDHNKPLDLRQLGAVWRDSVNDRPRRQLRRQIIDAIVRWEAQEKTKQRRSLSRDLASGERTRVMERAIKRAELDMSVDEATTIATKIVKAIEGLRALRLSEHGRALFDLDDALTEWDAFKTKIQKKMGGPKTKTAPKATKTKSSKKGA